MGVVYIYVALAAFNTEVLTLPVGSVEGLVDEAANVAVVDWNGKVVRGEGRSWDVGGGLGSGKKRQGYAGFGEENGKGRRQLDWRTLWNEGTDAVMDMPVGGVCEILYGVYDDDDYDEYG